MYRRPRIIPSLLLQDGGLVKTQKFDKPRYLGDPVNAVKIFNNKGVDELCILDISAPRTGGEPDYDLLHDIATEAFMPLSYGGGVHSLEQIQRLFAIGYEKVILNTALVETPDLIREAVAYAGSQSIVASIDVKTDVLGRSFCYIRGGREKTSFSPIKLAQTAQALGAGEILLGSINRDGQTDHNFYVYGRGRLDMITQRAGDAIARADALQGVVVNGGQSYIWEKGGRVTKIQISGITIQDIGIFRFDIDMAEEIIPHKRIITFGMFFRQTYIFVHIESNDVLERNDAFFVQVD